MLPKCLKNCPTARCPRAVWEAQGWHFFKKVEGKGVILTLLIISEHFTDRKSSILADTLTETLLGGILDFSTYPPILVLTKFHGILEKMLPYA